MATHVFNKAKQSLLNGTIDLDTDDIRIALLSTNTTADTDNDGIEFVGDIVTLDEFDGANYVRKALATEAVNLDDPNDRAEFDADDVTFTALGAGTRSVLGILVYKHVTNDTDSPVIAFLEYAAAKTPDSSDFVVQWDAEGIIQAA